MTTRYDRMRAAAKALDEEARYMPTDGGLCLRLRDHANNLRADADELEAVEKEIRSRCHYIYSYERSATFAPEDVEKMADRIRGEK